MIVATPFDRAPGLGSDPTAALTSALETSLRSMVKRVTIRSTLSPDIVLSDPFVQRAAAVPNASKGPSLAERGLAFAQPTIVLDTSAGSLKMAPWGVPNTSYYSEIKFGALAVGALSIYGLWSLLK